MMQDKDQIIEQVAALVDNRENYQRILGKLALEYRTRFGGVNSLKELSNEIAERHGLKIAPSTLHNYSWVEDTLKDLEIPEDVPFRFRQIIAGSGEAEKWVKELMDGASTGEIIEAIKGKSKRPLVECPKCHFAFERPTYNEALKKAKEETKDFEY